MKYKILFLFIPILFLLSCSSKKSTDKDDWCNQTIRVEFSKLDEIETKSEWFKVYRVGENVYAISEPYNYEEVISYLILGSEKALLFDTGNGFDSISPVIKELTELPVTVINSHTHYDHIGGNYEFDNILAFDTDYTLKWAENGWSHELVKNEVSPDAFCSKKLPKFDTSSYCIKPFTISKFIQDGHKINLGKRIIEVISVPGHTPDAMALLDRENGYLWTGDTYYEASIWLFFDGTDLNAYKQSIEKLAALSSSLNKIFPAHNTPIAEPIRLIELAKAFDQVLSGDKKAKDWDENKLPVYNDELRLVYEFEHFSFLIRGDHLIQKGLLNKTKAASKR